MTARRVARATKTWPLRVREWLQDNGDGSNPFLDANRQAIRRCLSHKDSGLRMVVNIPADALLGFLRDGRYRNAYDLPVVAGRVRTPSASRRRVDSLLGFASPRHYYFGAASIGGTGVRFYGEYCMVLKRDAVAGATQVLDRNSYDLLAAPLKDRPDLASVVADLRGEWRRDTVDMLVLKVLPELADATRLVTLGTVADAVLHDEDFLEVHRRGAFRPDDIEEIRETPEDQAIQSHILDQLDAGYAPQVEEMLWVARRLQLRTTIHQAGIRNRVVASAGRGNRWD